MNKIYFPFSIFLIQLVLGTNIFAQSTIKTLFLGNSYTAYNNLPQLVHDAALSVGDTLIFDSYTPGGMLLRYHTWHSTSQAKLVANNWDYVVLQGQSQEAITGNYWFKNGGLELNVQIKENAPCAVPLLYMTWGRKNGDASNCSTWPMMCTYEGMDSTIRNNYLELAALMEGEVSPVSIVWKYLRQNHPNIELYNPDNSHPSNKGSYAAACCFYATIFKKDPSLITYNYNLSPTEAAIIRNAVKTEVFNNLNLWDYKQPPTSNFSFKMDSSINTLAFFANDTADFYLWDFGDGTSSSLMNPIHSYQTNGAYTVELTTTKCDPQGLYTSTSDSVIQFCSHTPSVNQMNPWLCILDTLWTEPADSYQWIFEGATIPETNQYLVNYKQYGNGPFSVITTINGCAELSQEYQGLPLYSGYYFDKTPYSADPCFGDTTYLYLRNHYNNLTGFEFIQWYKDSVPISNGDSLMVTEGGFYELKTIEPNTVCPLDTTYSYIYFNCLGTSIPQIAPLKRKWSLYPNPASQNIWIQLDKEYLPELKKVQIYSAIGSLFKTITISSTEAPIDISTFPKGVYFLRLKNPLYPTLKFVKQ